MDQHLYTTYAGMLIMLSPLNIIQQERQEPASSCLMTEGWVECTEESQIHLQTVKTISPIAFSERDQHPSICCVLVLVLAGFFSRDGFVPFRPLNNYFAIYYRISLKIEMRQDLNITNAYAKYK